MRTWEHAYKLVVLFGLKEWRPLLEGQAVIMGVFNVRAEQHDVDIHVLKPQLNPATYEIFLHAAPATPTWMVR